jgi:hypothetical protein
MLIRLVSLALLALTVLAVPQVFWICAFTNYYESVLSRLPRLRFARTGAQYHAR